MDAYAQYNKQVKSLYKTIPLKNAERLSLQVDGQVRVLRWGKAYARLYVHVEIIHDYQYLLKNMVAEGRYDAINHLRYKTLKLDLPELKNPIFYNGYPVNEYVWYTLYVPSYIEIKGQGTFIESEDKSLELQLSN